MSIVLKKEERYPDVFNDVFGPVMRPFSSGSTASPCRSGYTASCLIPKEELSLVQISVIPSIRPTIHHSNRDFAYLSGVLGNLPDNIAMFTIPEAYKSLGIAYEIKGEEIPEQNTPDAVAITVTAKSGERHRIVSLSVGGGVTELLNLDGYPVSYFNENYAAVILDDQSELSERDVRRILEERFTILNFSVSGNGKGGHLYLATIEEEADAAALKGYFAGHQVFVLKPSQTVQYRKTRGPRLFSSFSEWKALAEEQRVGLEEIVLQYEEASSGWDRERILAYYRDVVIANVHRTTHMLYEDEKYRHLIEGDPYAVSPYAFNDAYVVNQYPDHGHGIFSESVFRALRYATAATYGLPEFLFIPGPMGMGGSLMYASISAVREVNDLSDEDVLRAMIVASGVGIVEFIGSIPGGGTMGCAGEQGLCAAMSAAGITSLLGGTADQIEQAASLMLQVAVGWPCDPQSACRAQPCESRVFTNVVMSQIFAEKALLGGDAVFSFDEVLEVAWMVGQGVGYDPELGHAQTKTAKERNAWFADQDQLTE